jgi:MOSC domain-containing protein YiiM
MHRIILFTGALATLPGSGRPTGMYKRPVTAPLHLGAEGFAGDLQADRRVHGGPEKAVHLYPAAHYARLARHFPAASAALIAGSLGENLSCATLAEADVHIGESFRLGAACLQLCQPRSPCWKIDDRFSIDGIAAFIAENDLTGWYFRVVEPGRVAPDDPLISLGPPPGAPTLAAALSLWRRHRPDPAELNQLASTPGIAEGWRAKIAQRADWLARESGPASGST